jgi:hypothetical protein
MIHVMAFIGTPVYYTILRAMKFLKTSASVRAVLVVLAALLLPVRVPAASGPPEKYRPVRVAKGMEQAVRGAVAWSPDGKHIAYIGKRLEIYDTGSGEKGRIGLEGAYFIEWASEGELLVLFRADGAARLGWVDAETLNVNETALPVEADAAYPLGDRKLLLAVAQAERISIGLDVRYGLSVHDLKDGSLREAYSSSRILPRGNTAEDVRGWLSAGPNPLGGETVLLELVDPPALAPYLRICMVDYATGRKTEITRIQRGNFRASGSWSPLGRRAALVDEYGRLRVLGLGGALLAVDDGVSGEHPAWNPRGGLIFFGGYMLSADGKQREEIVPGGDGESAAFWSPDGTRMALLTGGSLWLLSGFTPSLAPAGGGVDEALKGKIVILRDLLQDSLLTEKEYYGRYDALIEKYVSSRGAL